jgi:DNA-binding transcriptional LysR family regulator
MIDIRHLRYFSMLAEVLHFGRAAQRLHLSQPALSRQIGALEAELGVALFERGSRSVALTAAGQRFAADSRALLAGLEQAARNARAAAAGEQGALSVGFTMCAAYSVVPGLARAYGNAYPAVAFEIRELFPADLYAHLVDGRIDAAITFPLAPPPGVKLRELYREPLCVVLASDHRLARARRVEIGELAGEAFVQAPREVSPALHEAVVGCCRRAGFDPQIRLEAQLQQTILTLVAERVGVALVPQSMRRTQLEGIVFKPLAESPEIQLMLAWREQNHNPCLDGLLALAFAPAERE